MIITRSGNYTNLTKLDYDALADEINNSTNMAIYDTGCHYDEDRGDYVYTIYYVEVRK